MIPCSQLAARDGPLPGRSRAPEGLGGVASRRAAPARTACIAFGLNHIGSSPLTLAERWSGGRWRIQPTPGLVAVDSGSPVGVACPTVSACYAVGAYTINGPSFANLTLAEQWNPTGTGTQAVTGRPVAPGALPAACLCAGMLGPLPISGRSPATTWSRFRDRPR